MITTATLEKGVYTAKGSLEEELRAKSELRTRNAELLRKSDEAERQAYHDIMKIRREIGYTPCNSTSAN